MRTELQPAQRLLLWQLIANGGRSWQKKLRPVPSPGLRRPLEDRGLIQTERVSQKGNRLTVTEPGWAWAQENVGNALGEVRDAKSRLIQQVLRCFGECLEARHIPLAEVFSPQTGQNGQNGRNGGVEASIKRAYHELSAGQANERVRLADLRQRVGESRDAVDDALFRMMSGNELTLFRLDDPKKLTTADRQAAFTTAAGNDLHLVYLGGTPS